MAGAAGGNDLGKGGRVALGEDQALPPDALKPPPGGRFMDELLQQGGGEAHTEGGDTASSIPGTLLGNLCEEL